MSQKNLPGIRSEIVTYLAVAKLRLDADFAQLYKVIPSGSQSVDEKILQAWASDVHTSANVLNARIEELIRRTSSQVKSGYPICTEEPC